MNFLRSPLGRMEPNEIPDGFPQFPSTFPAVLFIHTACLRVDLNAGKCKVINNFFKMVGVHGKRISGLKVHHLMPRKMYQDNELGVFHATHKSQTRQFCAETSCGCTPTKCIKNPLETRFKIFLNQLNSCLSQSTF